MAFHFTVVLVLLLLACVVVYGGLVLQRLVAPRKKMTTKSTVYECGEMPIGGAWFNFNPRFYIVALVFVVFDVEIAFTFPIGVVYRRWVEGPDWVVAAVEVAVFILVLLIGLAYVWRKGDLEWIKRIWDDRDIQAGAHRRGLP
ncbi:MAG: NADH-quinone oxidoreductase subunit A [Deltaproteobacteria bacterium]|nr:NADH-quinone oxidoreductase subunit A [Deltaproteobacteria bacterium]